MTPDTLEQLEIGIPPSFAPVVLRIRGSLEGLLRRRPRGTQTRERGRKYARTEVCPCCFRSFTSKGLWRHARVCRKASR